MASMNKTLFKRALAVLLSASMAASAFPVPALAEMVDQVAAQQETAGQVSEQQEGTAQQANSEQGASEQDAGDKESGQGTGEAGPGQESASGSEQDPRQQASQETDSESDQATNRESDSSQGEGNAGEADQNSGQESDQESDSGIDSGANSVSGQEVQAKAAPALASVEDEQEVSLLSADASLDDSSYCVIQDAKDKDSYSIRYTGSISAGTTLWANMYNYYSDGVISAESDWTYQWMSSPTKASSASSYTAIVGQTSQSLTITDELAEQLAGSYIIVKVSANDTDYYGPSSYSPSYSSYYTPGPVLAPGSIELYSVELSNSSPSVGDTLTATAYKGSYYSKTAVTEGVTYTWSYADSQYGTFTTIAGQTGSTLAITSDYAGKYIKVSASAGANSKEATTSDVVMAEGAVKLYSVELASSDSAYVGATLTATAYAPSASGYGKGGTVTEGVTYTWQCTTGSASYSSSWTNIEGATANTFTVTDDYVGKSIRVAASAGANTVTLSAYSAIGPFKAAGQVDISAVSFANETTGESVYRVDETIKAQAKEKGLSTGVFIDASKLNYQWQLSDKKSSGWQDIEGATSETLELTADLAGKYVNCTVSSKVGKSSANRSSGVLVASANAVNVTKVTLSYNTTTLEPGDAITAKATDASGNDVTNNENVTWTWYLSEKSGSYSYSDTKIEGVSGNTLTIPNDSSYVGKYIQARADGGFGEVAARTSLAVTLPGAVELYSVTATGTAKVGQKLSASAKKLMSTSGTTSTYTQDITDSDTVSWQWQYAKSSATYDGAFTDIAGTTSKTYTIPETYPDGTSATGTYLRVKAVSTNTKTSTDAASSYGSKRSPLGPVTRAGVYTLSSVELSAIDASGAEVSTGTGFNVGNTITPQAMVAKNSYSEEAAPSDAKLAYTWYAADSASGAGTALTSGYDAATGALALTDSFKGTYLYVSAASGDNTVKSAVYQVMGTGEYELLRVTLTPYSGDVYTGDAVSASVQARTTTSTTTGDTLSGFEPVTWWVADSADADASTWTRLEGVSGSSITVPVAAAGKYLKAVAQSGSSTVEKAFSSPVVDANSLQAVAKKLADTKLYPEDVEGANVNELLAEKIAELGYEGINVSVKSAEARNANANAAGGISVEAGETNGDVTPFFVDLDSSYYLWSQNRQFDCVFTLSRDSETADTEELLVTLPWDASKVEEALESYAQNLAVRYATGDSADAVTQDVTLPYKLSGSDGYTKSWSNVAWESSDDAISIAGYSWGNKTGDVTRGSVDKAVTLTATIDAGNRESSGGPSSSISITKTFDVTVKADAEKVAAAKDELKAKVDAAFTAENIKVASTGETANLADVASDLQLPTTRTLGVDGKYYMVSYSASSDAVAANGYRAVVTRPIGPEAAKPVTVTLTVTSKENPEITATKSLELTVTPVSNAEIDAAVDLMEVAKADFTNALLGSNASASAVEADLDTFYEATATEDGTLVYARTSAESTGMGIYLDELPGYDAMSGSSWRTLRSSDTGIISDESLQVTRPEADSLVTVTGNLSYAAFESLAAAHPENEKLQSLVNQQVTATYRVVGTVSHDDPQISVGFELVGMDSFGEDQVWSDGLVSVSYDATAADLIEQVLDQLGLEHEAYGVGESSYYLASITAADGRALGYDASTGKYWQLFFNGEVSSVGAGQTQLSPGDKVVLYYSAWGDSLDGIGKAKVTATVKVIGADAAGEAQTWVSTTEVSVPSGSTAADATERVLAGAGLTYEVQNSWGWFLNSITSSDGRELATTQDYSSYWQFFINGEMAQVGAGSYELQPGDVITWYYGGWNAELPQNDVDVDPDATGPDWDSEWPGYANGTTGGIVTDASTATEGGKLSWAAGDLGANMSAGIYASEPIIVNGSIYLAVGDQLQVRDASTGKLTATATLATTVDSVARMVYVNTPATGGLIIVPLHGGRLQALTADTLTTRWITDELGEKQQSLGALTVADGYVYAGTSNNAGAGYLVCVNVTNGAVRATQESAGYYWGGAALVGSRLVIASNDGTLHSLDASSLGDDKTLSLGAAVYSQVVASDGLLYVVSRDGVLHRIAVAADGSLSETGSVSFASYSTSTPAIADGLAYVGGADGESGVLAVIDLATMTVKHKVTSFSNGTALPGEVKSSPTVSVQASGTYVYFTCNAKENGGAFFYKLGDEYAQVLYLTTGEQAEYTMSSLVPGSDGALYFVNDAGYLFRIEPGQKAADPEAPTDDGNKGDGKGDGGSTSDNGKTDGGVSDDGGNGGASDDGGNKKTGDGTNNGDDSNDGGSNGTGDDINGTGNDNNGSNKRGSSNVNLSLRSNTSKTSGGSKDTDASTSSNSDGGTDVSAGERVDEAEFASDDLGQDGQNAVTTAAADGAAASSGMPIWPFVGMALGAVVLAWSLWALVAKRRRNDDEE